MVAAGQRGRCAQAQRAGHSVRRRGLRRPGLLRFGHPHPGHRRAGRARCAPDRLPHHGDVLDHPGGAAHRLQPPPGGHGLPGQLRQRLSRLPRQDGRRGRHAARDAAPAWLCQLHAGQVACHPAERDRAHRPLRRLAAGPRLRPLLRLHGRRDRPVRARAGSRQHAAVGARHRGGQLRERLPPDGRPGRPGAALPVRPPGRPARQALADVAGARRLPCAAPGAGRADPPQRRRVRPRLGRRAGAPAGQATGDGHRAARRHAASAQRRRAGLGGPRADAAGADDPAAGRLRRDAGPCRPADRPLAGPSGGQRPARRHPRDGAVRQRRQPGGRAAGFRQRDGAVQPAARAAGPEAGAHRRHRRAPTRTRTSPGAGRCARTRR